MVLKGHHLAELQWRTVSIVWTDIASFRKEEIIC